MPATDSPQVRHARFTSLVVAGLICLALPTVAVLVQSVADEPAERRERLLWLTGAALVGLAVTLMYGAPYRVLGFVPLASLGWVAASTWSVATGQWPGWAHGLPLGLIVGALVRGRRGPEPVTEIGPLVLAVFVGAGVAWGVIVGGRPFDRAGYFVLAIAAVLAVWSWARFFRPVFELAWEPLLWTMYKVKGRGPGLVNFPQTGPCLIIANHACWFDPLFLAKVFPRPITPMMTAAFYDVPVLRRLMVAFGVIRVPEKALKKEAPEIGEAIAALDRGECVVIFPEGYLRRVEERPLRRFGQGVWQILQARPDTPVYALWIEGGWGSYTSYRNGRPTKNKRPDLRRAITIGVSAPVVLPAGELLNHLPTRTHLMNLVAAAREHIGLPPLPPFELPARTDDRDDGEAG